MQWVGYQQRYLADRSQQKAVVKSRRIGFSEVVSFERALRALGIEMIPGKPIRAVKPVSQNIVSASFDQSKAVLKRIALHINALSVAFSNQKVIATSNATLIQLANGAQIRAYSTNPRSMRGFEGDVLLDEFAFVPDQDAVWAAISPNARANLGNRENYQIVVVSTPLGDGNRFHEIIKGRYSNAFSQHKVTIHDAVRDGFPITRENERGETVTATVDDWRAEASDSVVFSQEYECFPFGTMIATPRGHVPIEDLRVGECVLTH